MCTHICIHIHNKYIYTHTHDQNQKQFEKKGNDFKERKRPGKMRKYLVAFSHKASPLVLPGIPARHPHSLVESWAGLERLLCSSPNWLLSSVHLDEGVSLPTLMGRNCLLSEWGWMFGEQGATGFTEILQRQGMEYVLEAENTISSHKSLILYP